MKSKKIIGLTGSIATGKSIVSNIICSQNYKVIDADIIAHELMMVGQINYIGIVKYFGKEILNEDLSIDRKKLGNIVFNDKNKLEKLNNLTHRNIFNKIKSIIDDSEESIIFVDIPLLIELLIEDNLPLEFDEIWLVYSSKEKQIKRLIERDNIDKIDAIKKIESQISIDNKKKYADFILFNTKDIEYVKEQVLERMSKL